MQQGCCGYGFGPIGEGACGPSVARTLMHRDVRMPREARDWPKRPRLDSRMESRAMQQGCCGYGFGPIGGARMPGMRRQPLTGLFSAIGTALLCLPALVQAFYCGEQLVEVNAGEDEVLGKCGVPDWSETWEEELVQKSPDDAFERGTSVAYAEWIYDLGPNRLIRILGFRNGVLKSIDTRAYAPASGDECSAKIVEIGDTKFEVLRKCGQPATRKQVTEKRMEPLDPVLRRRYTVTVERWTYRGKGDALPRTIVFRNRRVIDVESGSSSQVQSLAGVTRKSSCASSRRRA
jgi:hypothetical protein